MTPEQKLALMLAADTPVTPDRVFVAEVARRIALRRAIMTVLALVPWAVAAAALLWALRPAVAKLSGELASSLVPALGPGVATVALAGAALAGALLLDPGLRRRVGRVAFGAR